MLIPETQPEGRSVLLFFMLAFCILLTVMMLWSVESVNRTGGILLAVVVDVPLAFFALLMRRKESNSGHWRLQLEQHAKQGEWIRGHVETPWSDPPPDGVDVTFSCHAGMAMAGTKRTQRVREGFTRSSSGLINVPFALQVPTGIRMPGYYGEDDSVYWQLLCRAGLPVVSYTARFDVPPSEH